jgi:hypothetical protein
VIVLAAGAPSFLQTAATGRKLPIYCVQRDDKCVSLTFDAAWGNEDTQTLIDILDAYQAKATFFRRRRLGGEVPGIGQGPRGRGARRHDPLGRSRALQPA